MRGLGALAMVLFALLAMLAIVGCGGGDDDGADASAAPPPTPENVASVGDAPTFPPAPVEGDEWRPPDPTVIAAGATADGEPFELIVYGTADRGTCVMTMYPAKRSEGGGYCSTGDVFLFSGEPIEARGIGKSEHGVALSGVVSEQVTQVDVTYEHEGETQTTPAITEQVPSELLHQIGEPKPLGVFIAYLPPGSDAGKVTATAYSSDGSELGDTTWTPLPEE
jgi:hypothetical protein